MMGSVKFTKREVIKILWMRAGLVFLDLFSWVLMESKGELQEVSSIEFLTGFLAVTGFLSAVCWDTGDNTHRVYKFPRKLSFLIGIPSILCLLFSLF